MQLAGVQCAGNPHFWVNEDGSYQEEGQKNTKGYIWGKVSFQHQDNTSAFPCLFYYFHDFIYLSGSLEQNSCVLSCHCQYLLNLPILLVNKQAIRLAEVSLNILGRG